MKDGKKFKSALSKIMFYMYLVGSILFVFACSPTNVSQRNARNLIYILGLNFGKLVVSRSDLKFLFKKNIVTIIKLF